MPAKINISPEMEQRIIMMYESEKKSLPQICDAVGLKKSTVRLRLIELGVEMRDTTEAVGLRIDVLGKHRLGKKVTFSAEHKKNLADAIRRRWKGKARGFRIKNGYAVCTLRGENQDRGLHDLIVEKIIGRRLTKEECVHHIDENRNNNDLSNLALMTKSEHARLHRMGKKYTKEVKPISQWQT